MHPVLLEIGPLIIYSYGFMLMIAFLLSIFIAVREAKARAISADVVYDLAFWILLGGLIGARLSFVFYNWPLFVVNPWEAFAVWEGGLSFYGGLVGGLIAGLAFVYWKNLPVEDLFDIVGLVLPLGIAVGRVGCFLNGCCYGKPTQVPWGVTFPSLGYKVHPTQLYELVYAFFIFLFLYFYRYRIGRGNVFFVFLLIYSFFRFLNEFLRVNPPFLLGLSGSQVVSILAFVCSVVFLAFRFKGEKSEGFNSGRREKD